MADMCADLPEINNRRTFIWKIIYQQIKNFKVHLNAIYGSNMSCNIPGSKAKRFNNPSIYKRVDMGFSALLLSENLKKKPHLFRNFENI
jgi:hypothetical protein